MACLQSKTATELFAAAEKVSPAAGNPFEVPGWGPTVDMEEFNDDPNILLSQGVINTDVVVVAGSNTDEGVLFTPPRPLSKEAYVALLTEVLYGHGKPFNQTQLNLVLKQYPPTTNGLANHKLAASFLGDVTFVCGSRYLLETVDAYSKTPGYAYHFDIPTAGEVLHASEIVYVFDDEGGMSADEKAVARHMQQLWYSFAEGSGPGSEWPQYMNATDTNIVFRSPLVNGKFATETGRRKEYCDFWTALYPAPYPHVDGKPQGRAMPFLGFF
jgi:carboxylesterase type B